MIDRLLANGIDLTESPVEVSQLPTTTWAAEALTRRCAPTCPGCSRPARQLRAPPARTGSRAISEALVFGEWSRRCAGRARAHAPPQSNPGADSASGPSARRTRALAASRPRALRALKEPMWRDVGAFRDRDGPMQALA